jgi:hypothetical protein
LPKPQSQCFLQSQCFYKASVFYKALQIMDPITGQNHLSFSEYKRKFSSRRLRKIRKKAVSVGPSVQLPSFIVSLFCKCWDSQTILKSSWYAFGCTREPQRNQGRAPTGLRPSAIDSKFHRSSSFLFDEGASFANQNLDRLHKHLWL